MPSITLQDESDGEDGARRWIFCVVIDEFRLGGCGGLKHLTMVSTDVDGELDDALTFSGTAPLQN